ncbi:MAG TPA: acyltransferase [Terriglobales bacterium]|nr:acyltransferase [Terriglobales bacterium]
MRPRLSDSDIPSSYLPTLDGWRGVAILLVLFCHVHFSGNWSRLAQEYSALAVDLFFAISGLLITDRMLQEHAQTGRISLRGFYIRRVFRIFPAAFLFLAAVSLLCWLGLVPASRVQLLSAALFFRNYYYAVAPDGWFTGHFWSLSVEEHFYFFWPCLLILMGVSRARRITPWIAVAAAAWRTLDSRWHFVSAPSLINVLTRTDYCVDFLLWGCVAGLLLRRERAQMLLRRLIPAAWPAIGIVFLLLLVTFRPKGNIAAIALLMPTFLLATLLHQRSWLARMLESLPMRSVGRMSYSLYLWQQLFLINGRTPTLGPLQSFPLNLVIPIALAWCSHTFLEEPLRRYGKKLASRTNTDKTIETLPLGVAQTAD